MLIKFNHAALVSVTGIRTNADHINSNFVKTEMGEMSGLAAAQKYIDYEDSIKSLMSDYQNLLYKDSTEMMDMLMTLEQIDSRFSAEFRKKILRYK